MAEKVIRAAIRIAIRIVRWRTFHSTFGLCGLFQQLAKFGFLKNKPICDAYQCGHPNSLLMTGGSNCSAVDLGLKQLAGAALVSSARGGPHPITFRLIPAASAYWSIA
jgi:hypothetical protein